MSLVHYTTQCISLGRRLIYNRFNGLNKDILVVHNNGFCTADYDEDIILIYSVKVATSDSKGRNKYPLLAREIVVDHI